MPTFAEPADLAFLPNWGGTINSYGIDPLDMTMAASLLPGGGSPNAAIGREWIVPTDQVSTAPSFLAGLGCRGMADYVPGQPRGMGDGSANASSTSASNASSTAYGGTSNVSVQVPQPKGMLEGDQGPILVALAGLGILGAILLKKG